jgi:hypothetical protein
LDVTLLVKNTEFIIFINKLDTHIVTGLASHFIFEDKVVHFLLEGVDDEIELITFVNLLSDNRHLVLVSELFLVEFTS